MLHRLIALVVITCALPIPAFAHKFWLLPSQTVLSGSEPYVTVDAAVSNDLFYFNHFPLRLDNLRITAPDGASLKAENPATLRYRSVFDVPLSQEGTYCIGMTFDGLFGSWEQDGKPRRWRGSRESFAAEVPADAKNLKVNESVSRVETFVTNGAPTERTTESTAKGIELVPVTHPNDLYSGEEARFRFTIDGQPAGNLKVVIVKGGTRYRNTQNEVHLTTDASGEITIKWDKPGMYWMEATSSDNKTTFAKSENRWLTYVATLEVLPQ